MSHSICYTVFYINPFAEEDEEERKTRLKTTLLRTKKEKSVSVRLQRVHQSFMAFVTLLKAPPTKVPPPPMKEDPTTTAIV